MEGVLVAYIEAFAVMKLSFWKMKISMTCWLTLKARQPTKVYFM